MRPGLRGVRQALSATALVFLFAPPSAGRSAGDEPRVRAESWPAADELFRHDPRWRGGDGLYSVPLGSDRVLWLFGDTWIAPERGSRPHVSRMIHNSVAVERGLDPSSARIAFYWDAEQGPGSYFPEDGDRWYWPGHGIRIADRLVLFLQRVRATPGRDLGFHADGWRVAIVENPDAEPDRWRMSIVGPGAGPDSVIVGTAVWRDGSDVVALGQRDRDHAGFLVRWPAADLARGRLERARWWVGGAAGWVPAARVTRLAPVLADAGPECSLHRSERLGLWLHVLSVGFGASEIGVHFAPRPQGPWSATRLVYRPPESNLAGVPVYAAKGHPELKGADLVVTYAANTLAGLDHVPEDTTLCCLRFVRLSFDSASR